MDIRQLRYFLAVAESGHITRAAARLGLQQPPLSQQIRVLEGELGLALFERHPKGVTLTDAGRALQAGAQPLVDGLDGLRQRMAQFAAGRHGRLAVGLTQSAAAHGITPDLLRTCHTEYPDIELRLAEDNAAGLTEAVADHRLHFALLRVPVARPAGLIFEALLSEPAVLVLPASHLLARRRARTQAVPLEALAGEPLILVRRQGAPGLYSNLLELLQSRRIDAQVAAEVERSMTAINLVAAGRGISILPASMQGLHAGSVVYRALPADPMLQAPITLVRRDASSGPVYDRVLALVHRVAGRWRRAAPAGAAGPRRPPG